MDFTRFVCLLFLVVVMLFPGPAAAPHWPVWRGPSERGITFLCKPNPEEFEKGGEFQLGNEGFATPVFVGEEVFVRAAERVVNRREFLYCPGG